MRLLESKGDDEFTLKYFLNNIPPYGILSHTWGSDGEEVTFKDLENREGKDKIGYGKLRFCGKQAENNGLKYCIDKSSTQRPWPSAPPHNKDPNKQLFVSPK